MDNSNLIARVAELEAELAAVRVNARKMAASYKTLALAVQRTADVMLEGIEKAKDELE